MNIQEFDKLNQVIDAATAAGANQVGGIQFTLSKEKEEAIESEVKEEAIAQAKENAKELANLAGMKLGKIVNVVEQPQNTYEVPMFARADVMEGRGAGGGEPTQIEPGSTTFKYSVMLSYETL